MQLFGYEKWHINASVCLLPDLQCVPSLVVLLDIDVDGKVSIDVSHLVLVAFRDANHQVLNERFNGSEGSDVLSRPMVDFDLDKLISSLVLRKVEGNSDVRKVLGQFACTRVIWLVGCLSSISIALCRL